MVGVVRIEGPISSTDHASADSIVPLLEKAFANPNVKAVVLSIDSPGGAPVEAERIYTAIGSLKRKHDKPVVAVINSLGASAAFLVALHADKIVAGRYSLVGSIGAIMAPWQLDRAIARYDVSQRVYASGMLKAFLNPFTPVTQEVDQKAQKLVDQLGTYFLDEVKARRGAQLKPGIDVATGEVWAGPEAKEIGLVDDVGTLDDYVANTWGVQTYDFGPSTQGLQLLGRTIQGALVNSVPVSYTHLDVYKRQSCGFVPHHRHSDAGLLSGKQARQLRQRDHGWPAGPAVCIPQWERVRIRRCWQRQHGQCVHGPAGREPLDFEPLGFTATGHGRELVDHNRLWSAGSLVPAQ